MNAHTQLMHVLDVVTDTAFVCALVTLPFFVVNFLRYRSKVLADRSLRPKWLKAPFPIKSVGSFAGSIAIAMIAAEFSKHIAHADVLHELAALPPDYSVSVAGRVVAHPQHVIEILRSLRWAPAHHSHPTTPVWVRVLAPSHDILLNLSRDSSDPHEYWVFLPRYRVTSRNEIGRIFTDIFDEH